MPCLGRVSNPRPTAYETAALPAELPRLTSRDFVRPEGLEPPTYGFVDHRSIRLSYGRKKGGPPASPGRRFRYGWQRGPLPYPRRDSNARPLPSEGSALIQLSYEDVFHHQMLCPRRDSNAQPAA